MKKSKNDTLLNSRHDKFSKILKALCKERSLTYYDLGKELYLSESSIKNWMRKDGSFPSMESLVILSELFDVDVAYLLGEQEFRKIESQRISDLTGFSEKSSDMLRKYSGADSTLNKIFSSEYFPDLIKTIHDYEYSHNHKVEIKDETGFEPVLPATEEQKKGILKYSATDVFSKLLDSLYDTHAKAMNDIHDIKMLKEMLELIHRYHGIIENTKNAEAKKIITETPLAFIRLCLNCIESDGFQYLQQMSPNEIYENYLMIANQLGISLD